MVDSNLGLWEKHFSKEEEVQHRSTQQSAPQADKEMNEKQNPC